MASSLRRAPVPAGSLHPGTWPLAADTAHYITHVLRLGRGDLVQLFDGTGQVAEATLQPAGDAWEVVIQAVRHAPDPGPHVTLAVAVPKGERADWLLEKATELGVARVVWLACARSVVIPKGANRAARWQRIAEAAARQAGRNTVPPIAGPTAFSDFIAADTAGLRLIAQPGSDPLRPLADASAHTQTSLLIGPEGGFTLEELRAAAAAGYTAASLSRHILRIETAAVAGATLLLAPAPTS